MTNKNGGLYEFGRFVLDPRQNLLMRGGEPVKLPAKAFELLLFFVQNPNQVVDKETLMLELWKGSFVEDANLAVHISNLRKIFAEDDATSAKIETFPKAGYRFVADVRKSLGLNFVHNPTSVTEKIPTGTVDSVAEESTQFSQSNNLPANPSNAVRRNRYFAVVGGCSLIAAILLAGFMYFKADGASVYRNLNAARLTNLGMATRPAVSADGKYVVYGREEKGTFSIWIKVIASTSETQVVPPTEGTFYGATFLPDGKSLVYGARLKDQPEASFVIPVFGGNSVKLPLTRALNVVFSPDGKQLAYLYNNLPEGKTHLVLANADGSDERLITTRQAPNYYWTAMPPSWSPDGKRIVCTAQNAAESTPRLVVVDIENGTETPLSKQNWSAMWGVAWLPDGRGLLAIGAEATSSVMQIWYISYPDGAATRVSNNTINYDSISVSADGRTIATTELKEPATIWVVPVNHSNKDNRVLLADTAKATQISSGKADGSVYANGGPNWTNDGRLVFAAEESGNSDIWIMNADGSGRKQLTTDKHQDTGPDVSADGKEIVFMSTRSGTESLWLMAIDGSNQRRITSKLIQRSPSFTPDGRWIYFVSWETGIATIWRMPSEGGESSQVVSDVSFNPVISGDGELLLYATANGTVIIKRVDDGLIIKNYLTPGWLQRWVPSMRAFSFLGTSNGVSNLWLQSLDSDKPVQITDFVSDGIRSYGWSSDGKSLAVARGSNTSDVIVMTAGQ